ncbi:hypothetical protein GCM10007304_17730 [Rhodococcoides trifolii]|uniref:Uncharacterized protein n=1 Tax=Rhodococcoides trifolii TaxID=908250 RepID=A0A917CZT5_9NOCA|nr:hypothetical protein [Rhodococcus trifolii]GGG04038.1 hypothetical protein GCM10007304_17730 [Rhodococcus trifolii]
MATAAPPVYVPAPPVTPSRYGLLSAADIIPITDPHTRNGVQYQTAPDGPAHLSFAECVNGKGDDRSDDVTDGLPWTEAGPIVVYNGFVCRAVGLSDDERQQYARDALAGGEAAAVEKAIWATADPLRLMETGLTDILSATPVSVVAGIAMLERQLGNAGVGVGVIHAPREVAPHAAAKAQIESDGARKVTVLGTRWAFGAYPTTDPDGVQAASNVAWMVATGPVVARRTEVVIRPTTYQQAFDQRNNDVFSVAERTWVIGWDDRVRAAVPVTLPTT